MRGWWLLVIAACGSGQQFGKIVTEVSLSPDPHVLQIQSCALIATAKSDLNGVRLGDCQRYGVRRSPIVPVPLTEARVLAREDRIVTGFVERPGGGALVTTCRIGQKDTKWTLLDCVETAIATAPLDAPAAPNTLPTTPPVPQPYPGQPAPPATPPVPQPYPGPSSP